jgi:hypothetical protein
MKKKKSNDKIFRLMQKTHVEMRCQREKEFFKKSRHYECSAEAEA